MFSKLKQWLFGSKKKVVVRDGVNINPPAPANVRPAIPPKAPPRPATRVEQPKPRSYSDGRQPDYYFGSLTDPMLFVPNSPIPQMVVQDGVFDEVLVEPVLPEPSRERLVEREERQIVEESPRYIATEPYLAEPNRDPVYEVCGRDTSSNWD